MCQFTINSNFEKKISILIIVVKQWRIQDFAELGAPTFQGAPTYDFAQISQKLHEIENLDRGARPKFYFVDPPLKNELQVEPYL